MKYYEATATIEAPATDVWTVLVDSGGFTSWDSGIERFEGTIALNEKVKVFSEVSPGRAFPVRVVVFDEPTRMVWKGGMPLGLFTGVRTFSLAERAGVTEFTMREEFTGPLLNMMWRSMPDLSPTFTKFAEGLKARVETQGEEQR